MNKKVSFYHVLYVMCEGDRLKRGLRWEKRLLKFLLLKIIIVRFRETLLIHSQSDLGAPYKKQFR